MTHETHELAVNCSILLTELPLLERPRAARAAGFTGVEFWWPFESAVPEDKEVDAFVSAIREAGVALVGLNLVDDIPAGRRGLVSVPSERQRFRENISVAVGIAEQLGCRALNALYGNRVAGVDPREQDELAVENLALAGRAAQRIGAVVLVEALNSQENPAYPLTDVDAVLAVIEAVGREGVGNLAVLADLYHLARMGADLEDVITRHAGAFRHVQIADTPGRGAPGTGALDIPRLLELLATHGYTGWIGLEYKAAQDEAFTWRGHGSDG
jgi:hydroxypyruvate isomerase